MALLRGQLFQHEGDNVITERFVDLDNILPLTRNKFETHAERRKFPRITCHLSIYSGECDNFAVKDISCGGMRVETRRLFGQNSFVPIQISDHSGNHFLNISGQIVWADKHTTTDSPAEYGVRFLELGADEVKVLKYLIYRLGHGDGSSENFYLPFSLVRDSHALKSAAEKVRAQRLSDLVLISAKKCLEISKRPLELWQWCQEGIEKMTLSCVDSNWKTPAQLVKLLSVLMFTTIDDIADQLKDRHLLRLILRRVFGHQLENGDLIMQKRSSKSLDGLVDIWSFIRKYIQAFPRYAEFKHIFFFDYSNLLRGIEYALLVNERPALINEAEGICHQAYEVHILPNMTMDLMCSSSFDFDEIGRTREISWFAQNMCRITNWLATWRREIKRRDFTSGVVSLAIKERVVSLSDLLSGRSEDVIAKIEKSEVENQLMAMWARYWTKVKESGNIIKSIDLDNFLRGVEHFFRIQIACDKIIYRETDSIH